MKKNKIKILLLVSIALMYLFGCILMSNRSDSNAYWDSKQYTNMLNYAKQMVKEIRTIANDYDETTTKLRYGEKYMAKLCHNVFINVLEFKVDDNLYHFNIFLTPNENDEAELHEITLNISTPDFNNLEDITFLKENFLIINDLLHYLNNYVSAESFVDLDQIIYYLNDEKIFENKDGISLENKALNVYYHGQFSVVKDKEKNVYHYSSLLTFSKCSNKIK